MTVPIWLGYFMLIAFSICLVVCGLALIMFIGGVILDELIPKMWIMRQRMKVKNLNEEQLEQYLAIIVYEWEEANGERGYEEDDTLEEESEES